MIIGITGKNASGKGEAASHLKSKGFIYYSLSDIIRDKATEAGLEHSRDNLIKLGNELRAKFGSGYLAEQINEKIRGQDRNFVVDSIRNPNEARELMKNRNFILVGIEAPIEIRFKRLLERNRLGDAKTLEGFKEQEQRENLKSDTNQRLDATFAMAQKVIVNGGTLEELHKKIDGLIKELKQI